MARLQGTRFGQAAMVAALALTALTGCSVSSPGAGEDRSYDGIERIRAAHGSAPDNSYEAVEKNRLSIFASQDAVRNLMDGPRAPGGGR